MDGVTTGRGPSLFRRCRLGALPLDLALSALLFGVLTLVAGRLLVAAEATAGSAVSTLPIEVDGTAGSPAQCLIFPRDRGPFASTLLRVDNLSPERIGVALELTATGKSGSVADELNFWIEPRASVQVLSTTFHTSAVARITSPSKGAVADVGIVDDARGDAAHPYEISCRGSR